MCLCGWLPCKRCSAAACRQVSRIRPLQDGESAAVMEFVEKGAGFPKRKTRPEGLQQVEDRFGTTNKNAMKTGQTL